MIVIGKIGGNFQRGNDRIRLRDAGAPIGRMLARRMAAGRV